MSWKEVKNVTNRGRNDCAGIRDRDGGCLIDLGEVKSRWRKYFDDLPKSKNAKGDRHQ